MSLIQDVSDIKRQLSRLDEKCKVQQNIYFTLISDIVKLHQQYRIAEMYDISDELRKILNNVGVEIIQGTAKYKYHEIPQSLRGRQVDDTWKIK